MGNTNAAQDIFNISEIKLIRSGNTVWTLNGRFTPGFAAGIIAGGEYGLSKVNENTDDYLFTYSLLGRQRVGDEALVNIKKNKLNNENTDLTSRCQYLENGYNLWLRFDDGIVLYTFESAEFVRGLLTILIAFNIDYREAILEAPLWVSVFDGNYVSEYRQIEGYLLPIPAPLQEAYITCNNVLNRNLQNNTTVEDRINNITPYIRDKFAVFLDTEKYSNNFDNLIDQLQIIFMYTHPTNDTKTADEYVGFTDYGNRANPDATNHYLRAYGYIEQ